MMLAQKVKKKSVVVYLFYSKSYNKLKHEEILFHADVSDERDRANSQDTSSASMTCNNHEPLTPLFNTNTDITMMNDFSSILNNSLYFEESFDRKNICLECSCTYTDQFVIFKTLTYCFKVTIGFDVKTSFASRP